jgi:hypothetical protein
MIRQRKPSPWSHDPRRGTGTKDAFVSASDEAGRGAGTDYSPSSFAAWRRDVPGLPAFRFRAAASSRRSSRSSSVVFDWRSTAFPRRMHGATASLEASRSANRMECKARQGKPRAAERYSHSGRSRNPQPQFVYRYPQAVRVGKARLSSVNTLSIAYSIDRHRSAFGQTSHDFDQTVGSPCLQKLIQGALAHPACRAAPARFLSGAFRSGK